jgi:hypothetical protein
MSVQDQRSVVLGHSAADGTFLFEPIILPVADRPADWMTGRFRLRLEDLMYYRCRLRLNSNGKHVLAHCGVVLLTGFDRRVVTTPAFHAVEV